MRWWILGAIVSLIAVADAESQPRQPGVNGVPIRVRSGGNERVVEREAPVAGCGGPLPGGVGGVPKRGGRRRGGRPRGGGGPAPPPRPPPPRPPGAPPPPPAPAAPPAPATPEPPKLAEQLTRVASE